MFDFKRLLPLVLTVSLSLASTAILAAGFDGAIFTTLETGDAVNHNIYASKDDVYLNGGPQNLNANGIPDGVYYFQVTSPSGVLLSTSPASHRQAAVINGRMAGNFFLSPLNTGALPWPGDHPSGIFNVANGTKGVKLMPFDDTPNPGGEYKVWLIRQTSTTTIANDGVTINFLHRDSKTDNFKVRTAEVEPATIIVNKYFDANMSGTNDGEEPLNGFQYEVTYTNMEGVTQTVTLTSGEAGFIKGETGLSDVKPGTPVTVCEIQVPDWIQTEPGSTTTDAIDVGGVWCYYFLAPENGGVRTVVFGNTLLGDVQTGKYFDANMNCTYDQGDSPIAGWKIKVKLTYPNGTVTSQTLTTDGDGLATLTDLPYGTQYCFSEVKKPGWKLVSPTSNKYEGTIGSGLDVSTIDASTTIPLAGPFLFGNIPLGCLIVEKRLDADANKAFDTTDPPVEGWTIKVKLVKPNGATSTVTLVTNANGKAKLNDLPYGTAYKIYELQVAGWVQTYPEGNKYTGVIGDGAPVDAYTVIPAAGPFRFGNVPLVSIKGSKWYDANGNGVRDNDEPAISGWKIHYEITNLLGLPVPQSGDIYTDANGRFKITGVPIGSTYVITEVMPTSPGGTWKQTYVSPNASGTVTLGGGPYTVESVFPPICDVDFGNRFELTRRGHTLGFWSNKNGQSILGVDGWLSEANPAFNAAGAVPDLSTYAKFRTWLLDANATNMAYMLSVQLTAQKLNVKYLGQNPDGLVATSGAKLAAYGYTEDLTIGQIIALAESLLLQPGGNLTVAAGPLRTKQGIVKNLLDSLNNNSLAIYVEDPPPFSY